MAQIFHIFTVPIDHICFFLKLLNKQKKQQQFILLNSKQVFFVIIISLVGSQKLVSLIFTFYRTDKKLNNFC